MHCADITQSLQASVRAAYESAQALRIVGGNSKAFLGREVIGDELSTAAHQGLVSHEPTELVVTVRTGTRIEDAVAALAAHGQMLPFEPPRYDSNATIGGVVAAGLSGPRRPYVGAARDFILGTRLLNGRGDLLRFGGEVMKNVAGYDVSRLMAGAHGTLGVLLDISFKVLPYPELELTLRRDERVADALATFNMLATRALPISASAWIDGVSYLRISGSEIGVRSAAGELGWEVDGNGDRLWASVRDHQHPFFSTEASDNGRLWRLSLPPDTALETFAGETLIDWGGAQRWLKTNATPEALWQYARTTGGHATCFGARRDEPVFQPLPAAMLAVHRRIKDAFDPARILNPGRMYEEI